MSAASVRQSAADHRLRHTLHHGTFGITPTSSSPASTSAVSTAHQSTERRRPRRSVGTTAVGSLVVGLLAMIFLLAWRSAAAKRGISHMFDDRAANSFNT